VAWSTGPTPEQTLRFLDLYPEVTLEQIDKIAAQAMQLPGYKEKFARLGAEIVESATSRRVSHLNPSR
jgi:hypothetical protein